MPRKHFSAYCSPRSQPRPPAANRTTIVTGHTGYVCAHAARKIVGNAAAPGDRPQIPGLRGCSDQAPDEADWLDVWMQMAVDLLRPPIGWPSWTGTEQREPFAHCHARSTPKP